MSDITNIKLKPVCDCGYIFENIKMSEFYKPLMACGTNKLKVGEILSYTTFYPNKCPNCGKFIGSIELDSNTINKEVIHDK